MEISNERLLKGARNLKAKGYTPEQVDGWLKTKGSSLNDMKSYATSLKQDKPTFSPEQIAQVKQNNEDYANKNSLQGVVSDKSKLQAIVSEGLKGVGQGAISGLGRVLSGATLGASDWIDRKTGGNLQQLDEELQQDAKRSGAIASGLNNVAKFGAELGGNTLGASRYIMSGAKTLSQMLKKGAIESGIYGATNSDTLDELPVNVAGSVALGTAATPVVMGIGKGLGAVGKLINPNKNAQIDATKSIVDALGEQRLNDAITSAENKGRSLLEVADNRGLDLLQGTRQNSSEARDIIERLLLILIIVKLKLIRILSMM